MSNLLEKASILLTPTAYDDGKILSVKPSIPFGEELVTNGDFSDGLNGWTATNAVISASNSILTVDDSANQGLDSRASQSFTTKVGSTYKVRFNRVSTTSVFWLGIGAGANYRNIYYANLLTDLGFYEITFIATNTTSTIALITGGTGISKFSDVSVKEVLDADFDFTRNSSATRVNSQGLIEDMQTFSGNLVTNGDFSQEGPELVTNGDFSDGSTRWNLTNFSIINEKAVIDSSSPGYLIQLSVTEIGKTYRVEFTVSDYVEGRLRLRYPFVNNSLENNASNGTYVYYGVADETSFQLQSRFSGEDYKYKIDNVSVKEVGQDWTLGTGWSIGDNKAVSNGSGFGALSSTYSNFNSKKLKVNFDILNYVSGEIRVPPSYRQDGLDIRYSANGSYELIYDSINSAFALNTVNFNGSVTNISVIEITDDTNLPRIDYSPYSGAGTCGHWLFEPQSTQTATYSNDFTQGNIFVASSGPTLQETVLTSQQATSPDGTNNAWKLVDNNDGLTGQARLNYYSTTVIANNYNTNSFFVKKQGSNNFVYLSTGGFDAGANGSTWFDIQNGTLGDVSANHTANIENYGNGWYRVSITMQTVTDVVGSFSLKLATSNGAGNVLRDGTNGVYLFGVQAESDASRQFMTSYIPTEGSIKTRLRDAAFGAGSSDLISSTEGVLYLEVAALTSINNYESISLSDGGTQNRIRFQFLNTLNRGAIQVQVGSANQMYSTIDFTDITDFNKVAIKYKQNDFSVWLNGVKIFTNTSGTIPTLNQLNFNSGSNFNHFFGKTKCVAVFKEALTDDELECLTSDETSFSSFNALALANNYTII